MAIKKGDRLTLKMSGQRIPVEAASDESEGSVQIKYKGAISTASVHDLESETANGEAINDYTDSYASELLRQAGEGIRRLQESGDSKAKLDGVSKLARGGFVGPITNAKVPEGLEDAFAAALPKWPIPPAAKDVAKAFGEYKEVAQKRALGDGEKKELAELLEAIKSLIG